MGNKLRLYWKHVVVLGNLLGILGMMVVCATPIGPFVQRGAATPEDAILRVHGPKNMQNFSIQGVRPVHNSPDALQVIYTVDTPDARMLEYAFVERLRWGWYFASGSGFRIDTVPEAQWLDVHGGSHGQATGQFYVAYGRLLSSQVCSVEVSFSNGQTLRDEADDGIFAVAVRGSNLVYITRPLDANGRVLLGSRPEGSEDTSLSSQCTAQSTR